MGVMAFVLACPVTWYVMNKWLHNFVYRTELQWWVFAFAGCLVLSVTLITVSLQCWSAATRNPVEALRNE
jgi:putative ABC transport system permease protein